MNSEIDKNILNNNNIKSKRKTPVIPLILFATAISSFVIAFSMNDDNGAKMPTLIIALILAVIGIVKFFISDKLYIYTPTGETIKKYELFFEQKDKEKIISLLTKKELTSIMSKSENNENMPIKVSIYTTDSHSITICRAYQFIPYTYEAITEYQIITQ